jgi:hypothetical protein
VFAQKRCEPRGDRPETQLEQRIAPGSTGLQGYEGQPGNQGGGNHHGTSNGLKGYEGQPGNQGG